MCLCSGDHDDSTPTSASASMTTSGGASTTNSRDAFTATKNKLTPAATRVRCFAVNLYLPADFVKRCGCRGGPPDRAGRSSGKARRGSGLLDAMGGDHRRSGVQMFVYGRLTPGQHRGDARIGARENFRPFVAGPAGEAFREDVVHLLVRTDVELAGHLVGRQTEPGQQRRKELR